MKSKNIYLERYALPEVHIVIPPSERLGIIVTIPCYNEYNLLESLNSLKACKTPKCDVEIIIVINHGEHASQSIVEQNNITYNKAKTWAKLNFAKQLGFHIIYASNLPKKHAGVGLARKIAMDEATRRFTSIGNEKGIIACFDADSLCPSNYLVELEKHFEEHPNTPGCAIHFEHPLSGNLPEKNYEAIISYELFLRYYTHSLEYCGLPYAFQTVGSSMAVRSDAYQKQGGMNKRHAGEDFYFLHKIIALGNFTNLTATMTIPSPRESNRVPFGTGKAVKDWMVSESLMTYNPKTFEDIRALVNAMEAFYTCDINDIGTVIRELPENMQDYLNCNDVEKEIIKMKKESPSLNTFRSNFFKWLNAFKVLKMVHHYRDEYFENVPVFEAAQWILSKYGITNIQNGKNALLTFRDIDKRDRL